MARGPDITLPVPQEDGAGGLDGTEEARGPRDRVGRPLHLSVHHHCPNKSRWDLGP